MSGPWEDYAQTAPAAPAAQADGPWSDYAKPAASKPAAKRKRSLTENVTGFMANVNRGLGIGDELAAGVKAAPGVYNALTGKGTIPERLKGAGNALTSAMADQRRIEDTYSAEHPHGAALARGGGMAALAFAPTAPVVQSSNVLSAAARGATSAAGGAAAYALADRGTAGERLRAADSAIGPAAIVGGGLGAAANVLAQRGATAKPPKSKPMDLDQLKAAKNAAYDAVDQSGARYSPEAFDSMVDGIAKDAQAAKINALRHPKAASMISELESLKGSSPSLTELDQLRQVIRRDVANASDDAESYFGQRMIAGLDDFISKASDDQMLAGSGSEAADLVRNARDLNTRYRKVDAVTEAVEKAKNRAGSTGSGGNVDNAIRQNLRRVLETTRNLTPEEKAALQSAVLGDKLQNVLRQVGKLSPQGNGLMAAGNLASAASFGPAGAVPGTAGLIAKHVADNMTQRKVAGLIKLMSEGGSTQVRADALRQFTELAASDPAVAQLQKELAAQLSKVGLAAAPPRAGVSVSVEGRPDLGVGYSGQNVLSARP